LTIVDAVAQNKVYDTTTNATVTGTLSGVLGLDQVSLSSADATFATTNVGNGIAVTTNFALIGPAASNYQLTQPTGLTANITPASLTLTALDRTKVYGTALTLGTTGFTASGLLGSDAVSGVTLTSLGAAAAAGVNGGTPYALDASLAVGTSLSNYTITYVPGTLMVTARPITVTADAQSRLYGDANPLLTYAVAGVGGTGLVNGDTLSGALAVTAGTASSIGNYAIAQGTLANANYAITYVGANLTILPLPLTVTADSETKTAGNPDPTLAFSISAGNLIGSDALTGALVRDAGEAAGSYAIRIGTLTAGGNYALTFQNGVFTIVAASTATSQPAPGLNNFTSNFTSTPTDTNTKIALGPLPGGFSVEGVFQPANGSIAGVTTATVPTTTNNGVNPIVTGSIDQGTTTGTQPGEYCFIGPNATIICVSGARTPQ
jgi:hypothetical protein